MASSEPKKMKLESPVEENHCQHYVTRKKRFCKMTPAKGRKFCGEHLEIVNPKEMGNKDCGRVICPLDNRHTVYQNRLEQHLKVCNARPKENPNFIKKGINSGSGDEDGESVSDKKLSTLDPEYITGLITKINNLYEKLESKFEIKNEFREHKIMDDEISNPALGSETLKHLKQTSNILGSLDRLGFLNPKTCFIEFGAGKAQVTFYLSKVIANLPESVVVLVDKASHRHKKDNKVEERDTVNRIRADISDLDLNSLPNFEKYENIVGISKHLCGAATDFTIRCMLNGHEPNLKALEGILIAICCHHRCSWRSFVGKKLFLENGLTGSDFVVISKVVSWAVCGTGMSRERRKLIEEGLAPEKPEKSNINLTREEKEKIGYRCKRIIDFGRVQFLRDNQYESGLFYYINNEITLENVCIYANKINRETLSQRD